MNPDLQTPAPRTAPALWMGALVLGLAGCASAPAPAPDAVAAAPAAAAPAPAAAPANASVAGQARSFSTQLATYTAVSFDTLPGWSRDDFAESWPAFVASCRVLNGRGAQWQEICNRAGTVDGKSNP